jgi:hypothetical protein
MGCDERQNLTWVMKRVTPSMHIAIGYRLETIFRYSTQRGLFQVLVVVLVMGCSIISKGLFDSVWNNSEYGLFHME